MLASCPHCAFQAEIEAFFTDDDGKRLAAIMAEVSPDCGRAVLAYLRLFKPPKTSLRAARAVKLAREVADLVKAGTVCKDERSGIRRPATPSMWAAAIEQMLSQRDRLSLPLDSHGYLRAVVFGLADSADAAVERQREEDARKGKHLRDSTGITPSPHKESPLERQMTWIAHMVNMGAFTPEQAEHERAEARKKYAEDAQ
ncbi:MAG: hypothetical protein ACREPD_04805 [Stenotrophomonas sp.]|uniref:hypothetical protein n=1 Tax=Stenotrophomonas sp. TaxID=69392 RepID=UPI003D6CFC98